MEIIQVRSGHDLTMRNPEAVRPPVAHSYMLNCRQFTAVYLAWRKESRPAPASLAVMTLAFERIWITDPEISQISDAIRDQVSPLSLE